LVVKTQPSKQWEISRRIRERVKSKLDERGIEIPFPQQTVWMRMDQAQQAAQ
jgi:small conductance mechanosensitive channel